MTMALFDQEEITRIYGAEQKREGIREGIREGENARAREVARRMIEKKRLSLDEIAEYTNLPLSEVEKLANVELV